MPIYIVKRRLERYWNGLMSFWAKCGMSARSANKEKIQGGKSWYFLNILARKDMEHLLNISMWGIRKNIFRTSWCHGLKRVSGRCCNLAASVSNLSTANWALSLETWNYCVFNSFGKLILESWSLWDLFSKSARQCSRNLLTLRTFESIVPFNQRQKNAQKIYCC